VVVAVGEAAWPIAAGAGERAVALADNDAAVDWLRGHVAPCDVVLVLKASRGARLDEVAAALASFGGASQKIQDHRPSRLMEKSKAR
jgi:UDP-N-acetylmuramoyl-tripeptide--D-alanyl-D-alanine ligase